MYTIQYAYNGKEKKIRGKTDETRPETGATYFE